MLKRLLVGVSFLMLGAFGLQAQSSTTQPETQSQSAMQQSSQQLSNQDKEFARNAYESNLKEIKLGQLAEQQASSNEVKEYAREMVNDHTSSNDQLKQIAESKGIDLPSDVQITEQDQLSTLTGSEFDRQFLEHQKSAHEQAISMYENQAQQGQDPDLKSFASNQLDKLRQHEDRANTLMSSLSASPEQQARTQEEVSPEQRAMTQQEESRQLPRTASSMPLVGLFGLLLVGAALIVRSFRLIRN
jgi:putative membrane protein